MEPTPRFIDEDELRTFEGWMRYQAWDSSTLCAEERAQKRREFEETMTKAAAVPKVGAMKLRPMSPGEFRYAVAIRKNGCLWLTHWVRRSPKPEYFFLLPMGEPGFNPHNSYHLKGQLHSKSYDQVIGKLQLAPLTEPFRGPVNLGVFVGGSTFSGATCDPSLFTAVVEVPSGVLGPAQGAVAVDLVEPRQEPLDCGREIALRTVFRDFVPWIVVTIYR